MSRSIAVSELKRRKAAMEADILKIDGAIAVLESGIQHRQRRNNAKAVEGAPVAAPKRRRGRPAKVASASLAEVAE